MNSSESHAKTVGAAAPAPPSAADQRVASAASRPAAGILGLILAHPYSAVTLLTLAVLGIGAIGKQGSAWNSVQVGAARLLVRGQDFYAQITNFTYPPFSALISIPFVPLSPRVARGLWYLICIASLIYLIRKAWRLAGGPPLEPGENRPAAPLREQAAFLLGNLVALQFALNALSHLQSDLLIGALIMAGCGALAAGRYFRSATLIGIAAAFKATPLLFAPYLLWRRRWGAACWLVIVAVGANVLPNLVHAPPSGGLWLSRWCRQYLAPMASSSYLPGNWKNQLNNNQSIAGAVRRWMGTSWTTESGDVKVFDRPDQPSPAAIRYAFYGACVLVLIPALWIAWRRRRLPDSQPPPEEQPGARYLPDPRMIECGIILLLMLLLSPNSSIAHFCVMYLPAFCIARIAVHTRFVGLRTLLGLSALCALLSIHLRIPATHLSEQVLLWAGIVSFSTLFLMLACVVALAERMSESRTGNSIAA